ncbi:hypothetical protein GYMLUDRAFT_87970 [Collybiopsis luxurians FD-317 M1]|uniref:leucine--tRNA ligase n=1 Tax=Collybiopsis luxurians FD-317 M1 TaxID=944289 RepID=A0A0D0CI47_9AGAR|nr:hypothetical protein GYMLUDRAFT_87970 [Collybiopsis luxurians FD-317 M1]
MAGSSLSQAEIMQKYPKWFGNFPYPYMNGSLHLGHAFTISKIEFAAGYQRMLGKRVLFPHGFHVTGLPIKASADKLVREIELFGENFERYVEPEPEPEEPAPSRGTASASTADKSKGKKGKLAAKSSGHKYQFQILLSVGVPREDIKKFADPMHWLVHFPPIAIEDHNAFGSRIDWRRRFLTTKANPYYDAFVRWQVNKLYKMGKIKSGERYTIYSPKDGQPCMDHDRQDGEGVGPQEYTAIKSQVIEWSPAAKEIVESKIGGRKVYMVAATLRPETMHFDQEAYLITYRAARNMTFQGVNEPRGSIEQLVEIEGAKLVGTKINAPFSINPEIYVLPTTLFNPFYLCN